MTAEAQDAHEPSPHTARRLAWAGAVALLLAIALAVVLFWRHHSRLSAEADRRREEVDRASPPRPAP
jgi:ferric-dicitrate binding protein FerR (iron transport regulator)